MTKPIPDGYHAVTPHLVISGAARAIEFYKEAFGAEELFTLPGPGGSVMHAEIKIGDSIIMIGDEHPDCEGAKSPSTLGGSAVAIHLYVQDADAAFQRAVDAGAKPSMPPADMFWGDRYGAVEDPFGHRWSIATHTRDLAPDEIAQGAEAFLRGMQEGGGAK